MIFDVPDRLAALVLVLYVLTLALKHADAVRGNAYVRRNGGLARHQEEAIDEEEEEVEDELEDEVDYEDNNERKIAAILSASDHSGRPGQRQTEVENDKKDYVASLRSSKTAHSLADENFNNSLEPKNETHREGEHSQGDSRHHANYDFHYQYHYESKEPTAHHGPRISTMSGLNKESVFEQGETRDFLRFLQRIQYDHRQCPFNEENGEEPVLISVSVVVSNVRAVSEVTMDYSLEMFYRESWQDKRLIYEKRKFKNKSELALHESYANFLWHPDTFMPNAIASKNPRKQSVSHRSLLRLQSDGNVLYSRRLSIVAECPMDLTLFPFDSQVCKLGIESYGYTADQVRYGWSHGQRAALTLQKIRLPDFRIKEAFVTNQVENYATGNYSRLYICFVFTRSAGFCFLQLIIPSTAVVITSWVSMWMENETSFQDMISIILTILLLTFSYNEVMPRVSYLKALDIWLAVCFMVVFLSLIKLALCKYIRQRLQITQDTSIVADIIPLVRVAAANGIHLNRFQGQPSQYTLAQHNSCLSALQAQPAPQAQQRVYRPSLTIQNSQAGHQSQREVSSLARTPSLRAALPNHNLISGCDLQQQSSLVRNASVQSHHAVVGKDSRERRKRRAPTPPPSSGAQPRVPRLAGALENNNNNNSEMTSNAHELCDMRAQTSVDYDRVAAVANNVNERSRNKTSMSYKGGAISTAIEQFGGGLGQIIAHQALAKISHGSSYATMPGSKPLFDADTLSRISLSRHVIRQMHEQRVQEQQELQTRIETQLLQAQAQFYLRQKEEEQRRQRKKRRSRREMDMVQPTAVFNAVSEQAELTTDYYDMAATAAEMTSDRLGGCAGSYKETPRDFSINFSDDDSAGGISYVRDRLLSCFDRIGNVEFSAQFLSRFHWISQMTFFFAFVIFCFFFFLVYPNIRVPIIDPACIREEAEWFAAL